MKLRAAKKREPTASNILTPGTCMLKTRYKGLPLLLQSAAIGHAGEKKKEEQHCIYCKYIHISISIYIYICIQITCAGDMKQERFFLKSNPTLLLSQPRLGERHAHILPTCLRFRSAVVKLCLWHGELGHKLRNSLLDLFQQLRY